MKRGLIWLAVLLVTATVLGLLMYAVAGRPFFVRAVLLPRVSRVLQGEVTAEGAEFSPFSRLVLHNVAFSRSEPRIAGQARKLTVEYNLWSFLVGRGHVDRFAADGLELDVTGSGRRSHFSARLYDAELRAGDLRSGETATAELTGRLRMSSGPDFDVTDGTVKLQALIGMDRHLRPDAITTELNIIDLDGSAGGVELNRREVHLTAEARRQNGRWNVKQCVLEATHDDDLELRADVRGKVAADRSFVDLSVDVAPVTPAVINTVAAVFGDYRFGGAGAAFHGHFMVQPGRAMKLEGHLDVHALTVSSAAIDLDDIPETDIRAEYAVQIQPAEKSLTLQSLNLTAVQNSQAVIECRLDSPFTFVKDQLAQAGADAAAAELMLVIDNLDLRLANAFLVAKTRGRVRSGTLSAELKAVARKAGAGLTVVGPIRMRSLALQYGEHRIAPVDVVQDALIAVTGLDRISLDGTKTSVFVGDRRGLGMSHDGYFNLGDRAGRYRLAVTTLNETLLSVLPHEMLDGVTVEKLTARGHLNLAIVNSGKQAHLRCELNIPELVVADPIAGVTPSTDVTLMFDGERIGDILRVTTAHVRSTSLDRIVAHLEASGTVVMPPGTDDGILEIRSSGMDLKTIAGLGLRVGQISEAIAGATDDDDTAIAEEERVSGVLNAIRLTANLLFENWEYGHIPISSGSGVLHLHNGILRAPLLELVVNDAPFKLQGQVDFSGPNPSYEVLSQIEQLSLAPFVAEFAGPVVAGQVAAHLAGLTADVRAQGAGFERLADSTDGTVAVQLEHVVLSDLPWLDDLAQRTGIPELRSLNFDTGTLNARLRSGGVTVETVSLAGTNLRLSADGEMTYDGQIDLQARLAMGGAVLQRLRQRGIALPADDRGFYNVPALIPVKGPIQRPTHGFELRTLLEAAVREQGRHVLQDALDSVERGERIDPRKLLDNLLGGRTPRHDKPAEELPAEMDTREATPPDAATEPEPSGHRDRDVHIEGIFRLLERAMPERSRGEAQDK